MTTTTGEQVITPKKTNSEFAGFVRRAIRAHGRRVAAGDVEALPEMLAVAAELDAAIQAAVDSLHGEYGYSLTEIADRLGISRQAARQRWEVRRTHS